MYSEMALLYDRLMDDVDYAAWAAYYLELIQKAGGRTGKICECGCGTGSLTVELIKSGANVTATDLSEDMLRVASEKLRKAGRKAPLIRQDMRSLELPGPVDAILCCCDGVNYLTDDRDALAFFKRARESLRQGGVLAFDVSTRDKLSKMDGQIFCEERDDMAYLWKNSWDGETERAHMELSFYVRQPGGLYRRFEERQTQRGWRAETLTALLREAGFEDVRAYGERAFAPSEKGGERIHITAVEGVPRDGRNAKRE